MTLRKASQIRNKSIVPLFTKIRLKTEYKNSATTTVSTDFWKESYIKESVEKRVLEYCNTSLTKWIDYIIFREDIIHESIPEAAQELIASRMNDLCQMLEKIADDYIIMNYPPQIQ